MSLVDSTRPLPSRETTMRIEGRSRRTYSGAVVAERWRQAAGSYLALFFLAAAAAPHHHINDLEDLLFDQRSDSGVIVQTVGIPAQPGTLCWDRFRLVEDVPCLACFLGDFVCAPVHAHVFVAVLTPLSRIEQAPGPAIPDLLPARSSSRAPPRPS